jgi:hypothetical protein
MRDNGQDMKTGALISISAQMIETASIAVYLGFSKGEAESTKGYG